MILNCWTPLCIPSAQRGFSWHQVIYPEFRTSMTFKAQPTYRLPNIAEFRCAFCGAQYMRTLRQVPTPNRGKADCAKCGETMASWRSCTVPIYTPILAESWS
jgi:predicted SprT family Zn-dependent metalloprotease